MYNLIRKIKGVQIMYDRTKVAEWLIGAEPELTMADALELADDMIIDWIAQDREMERHFDTL